jgi:multisubunit Na+/H+ antiporter MnhB subunit
VWFEAVIAIGMITSAVFAIYLKETVSSVLSLSTMMILLSLVYFYFNTPYAANFKLGLGAGTAAIFLLAGDSLTAGNQKKTSTKTKIVGIIASVFLCIPVLIGTLTPQSFTQTFELSLSSAIWELRGIDVLAQGLVVLAAAIGVVVLLKEDWR